MRITENNFANVDKPSYGLLEQILSPSNLNRSYKRVKSNAGSGGVDEMEVESLKDYLVNNKEALIQSILDGTYRPNPVRRVEIPKDNGKKRMLGIPTVVDRVVQQAIMQVLSPIYEKQFSNNSYGFRPRRSAHQALNQCKDYITAEYRYAVDMDLDKFFDTVNQSKLVEVLSRTIKDGRVISLIHKYLNAGVVVRNKFEETKEGVPQGGPLSPLLSNIMLNELDKELERRGHYFVRYADDCNIYVRSARSGRRVMAGVTQYLKRKLKLAINEAKSAVDRPWKRTFLGFTFTKRRPNRRKTSEKAMRRFKEEIRRMTQRTRGVTLRTVISDLASYLIGWKLYFGFSEAKSVFQGLDSWVRRRLRCYLWKQWGRAGYRRLVERGVTRDLAWNTAKSAHGPWRISRSPALSFALPKKYFVGLGLPLLYDKKPVG